MNRDPMPIRPLPMAAAVCALLLLAGCAVRGTALAQKEYTERRDRAGEYQTEIRQPQRNAPFVVMDTAPRFASRSVPMQRASALPPNIGRIALFYPGRHGLAAVAELISRRIDIPVIMTPDALMDPSAFATTGGAAAHTPQAEVPRAGDAAAQASAAGARTLALAPSELQTTLELNYSGQLAGLLDQIAARAGLHWQYLEGKIVFSRIVTRAIAVKSLPNGVKASGTLKLDSGEGSGGGGGGAGGGGGSSGGGGGDGTSVVAETNSDIWPGLETGLKAMVSASGRLQVDARSGLVTVTDALANVERIDAFIQSLNTHLLRQVVLEVEVLQVNLSDQYSNGLDWQAVFRQLGSGNLGLTLTGPPGPGSFSGSAQGSLAFTVTARNADSRSGSLLARALEEYGKVGVAYSSVVTTTNRMPVPLGSVSTQAYLRETTPAVVSGSSSGGFTSTAGMTPGSVSTGFTMVLLPVILDSNRVLLQSSLQISSLQSLTTLVAGSGATEQKIQLPNVERFTTLQRMSVKAGDTLVLVGYEREFTQIDATDVVRNFLPVSRRGNRVKQSTVILITPRLTDS